MTTNTIDHIAVSITRNPTDISDTLCGRSARYVGGVSSPAVWYWSVTRGDKAALLANGNRSRKQARSLLGFRRDNNGTGQLRAVIGAANGYYSEVSC